MTKLEFEQLWNKCIYPSYTEIKKYNNNIHIRKGSIESICRTYNDIKNDVKKRYMDGNYENILLDRHKVAACLAKAIVMDKPIYQDLDENYTGREDNFIIVNELLAFCVAISILKAYIKTKIDKQDNHIMKTELEYRKIYEEDFKFPETIMGQEYPVTVAWAWHHNIIDGHFDVLGTANLLFLIEKYSVEFYKNYTDIK